MNRWDLNFFLPDSKRVLGVTPEVLGPNTSQIQTLRQFEKNARHVNSGKCLCSTGDGVEKDLVVRCLALVDYGQHALACSSVWQRKLISFNHTSNIIRYVFGRTAL